MASATMPTLPTAMAPTRPVSATFTPVETSREPTMAHSPRAKLTIRVAL